VNVCGWIGMEMECWSENSGDITHNTGFPLLFSPPIVNQVGLVEIMMMIIKTNSKSNGIQFVT
jgi:hypothetical protein